MWEWIRYQLERWVLRGSLALVALMIVILATIAMVSALVAYSLPEQYFRSYPEALWWAVLRLSDTGYLSDDTGGLELRALSMMLSVFGMAVTVGGIVAIVTQFMNRGLRSLSSATTRVPFSGHVVILGFSDRTPRLLRNLLARGSFRIVILVETVDEAVQRRVNRAVPRALDRERIVLRSGSARRAAELEHAACSRARAVIFPASPMAVAGDPEAGPRILQAMLALGKVLQNVEAPPQVAVEIVERSLAPMVSSALPTARVLQSDRLVARVFRFSLQGSGLVDFALDVIDPERGYRVQEFVLPALAGKTLGEAELSVGGGRLMGVLRTNAKGARFLETAGDTKIEEASPLLVFTDGRFSVQSEFQRESTTGLSVAIDHQEWNVLVLGWNECASDLIAELNLEPAGRYAVDIVARVSVADREYEIQRMVARPRVKIRHFAHDPMDIDGDEEIELARYDRIVVLADRSVPPESADVRTLAVVLSLGERKSEMKTGSYVLVELLEEENTDVLGNIQAVVTAPLAADTLCSLAFSPDANDSLQMSLSHQLTFVTRLFEVPREVARNEFALAMALRERKLGYMHTFDDDGVTCRVLACESVAALSDGPGHSSPSTPKVGIVAGPTGSS